MITDAMALLSSRRSTDKYRYLQNHLSTEKSDIMSSSEISSETPIERGRRKKPRRVKRPDHTISDISAYLEQVANDMTTSSQQASRSANSSSVGSSGSSSSYSPEFRRKVIPESPTSPRMRMIEEFQRHIDESDDWLHKWYADNYEKVEHYDQLRFDLLYILGEYLPAIKINEDLHPSAITGMVKGLLSDLVTKFNKFDLDLHEISGHEVAGYIQDHHRKVLEVVEDYETKLKSSNDEVVQCREQIAHLDAELTTALVLALNVRLKADLENRVALSESLNSSMKQELRKERLQNEELQRRLGHYARDTVMREEKCMRSIVDFSKRAEIQSMLEQGLMSMFERSGEKDPNSEDCKNLIDGWKRQINEAINANSKEIDELLKKIDFQNKDITRLEGTAKQQEEKLEELRTEVRRLKEMAEITDEEIQDLLAEIQELNAYIDSLEEQKQNLMFQQGQTSSVASTPRSIPTTSPRDRTFSPQPVMDTFSPPKSELDESFSPASSMDPGTYQSQASSDFPPRSADNQFSSPNRPINEFVSPESTDLKTKVWEERFGNLDAPKGQSLPPTPITPLDKIPPREDATTFPGANIRSPPYKDIVFSPGSFRYPIHSTSPTYSSGMDSSLSSKDTDYDFNYLMKHGSPNVDIDRTLENTVFEDRSIPSTSYTCPPIERAPLGTYISSPTGRVPVDSDPKTLSPQSPQGNMTIELSPHSSSGCDLSPSLTKTVSLASPIRKMPLHLNLEVAPQSISQSPSGEHVVCNIALGMAEAVVKPRKVFAYHTPPITRSVRRFDRQHGMFTPRSVFQGRNYAIRNLFPQSPTSVSPWETDHFEELEDQDRSPRLNNTIEWETQYLSPRAPVSESPWGTVYLEELEDLDRFLDDQDQSP
ncbi:uncharacterized protein NPIL_509971 [Nephila pilipes]|uniref:Uncharacterized protein n=1 Tax=Nephila pilipes TaxID=299642 RepID=A0A8X6NCX3_NEPPI|nr:uncharacterized protein NPIL_509971 [Nephila pilipes]